MDKHLEIIGAFVDGERIDAEALRGALATEEGRAYLVEIAAMRELVAMSPATEAALKPSRNPAMFLIAAAALAIFMGGAGFVMGSRRPSTPGVSQSPPAPTRILRLESGTNWTEDRTGKGGE